MDVKQAIILENKKGDFTFTYVVPVGSSWGQALDSAYEILQQVSKMSQENADRLKPIDQSNVTED